MTHTINNSKDRICCSSRIGKSIDTGSSLSNAEGADQDWEKDLSKRTQGKVTCPIPVSTVISHTCVWNTGHQSVKIRSIPWKFFSAQEQNLQGKFCCTNGFLQPQKYFFIYLVKLLVVLLLGLDKMTKIFQICCLDSEAIATRGKYFLSVLFSTKLFSLTMHGITHNVQNETGRFWPHITFLKKCHVLYIYMYMYIYIHTHILIRFLTLKSNSSCIINHICLH